MSDERIAAPTLPIRQNAHQQVQGAIARASSRTGIDFGYLMAQAKVESGLDADAKASTSSASGLFQFIESTWLGMMQRRGAEFGLGQLSSAISNGPRGPVVSDPALRGQILALRDDPHIASLMAGALAQENGDALRPVLGREANSGELYLAHFLGSSGAGKFLTALENNPTAPAASLFGKAASANRAIFYGRGGAPRSLADVMGLLQRKIENAMPVGTAATPPAGFSLHLGNIGNWAATSQPAPPPPINSAPSMMRGTSRAVRFADGSVAQLPKLSSLLRDNFSSAGNDQTSRAGQHAQRAYAKLKAFGL